MPVYAFPTIARDSGGEPPYDGGMEARVARVEADITTIKVDVASIKTDMAVLKNEVGSFAKHYATKADVTEAKNSIIMWVVSAILLAQLLPPILKKFGL